MSNDQKAGPAEMRSAGWRLALVNFTYVAVTVGESLLAPLLPVLAPELELELAASGRVLGVLSLSIGLGNLLGGWLLARRTARATSLTGTACSAAGCFAAAAASGEMSLIVAHVLIGIGAGLFYAGGVFSINALTEPERIGRAMARFGIAFSVALGIAAAMAVWVSGLNWRWAFAASGALAVLMFVLLIVVDLPGAVPVGGGGLRRAFGLLGDPILVGGVAALAQFGLVVFIPVFAVEHWSLGVGAAAGVLLAGRVVSVPGKFVSGFMIDRMGAERASRTMGMVVFGSGLAWVLVPSTWAAIGASVVFASAVGALFPMANVVAVGRFGVFGSLLGVFRFSQMVIAAVSVAVVGLAGSLLGLRPALALGMLAVLPILLLRTPEDAATDPATAA